MTHTDTIPDREWLRRFQAGERIRPEYSMFAEAQPHAATCRHDWRVIVCSNDRDVCECRSCGTQREFACNFDEDMS